MANEEIEGFLAALQRSGLLPEGRVRSLLAELSDQGARPLDAPRLADEFVRREILTDWQAAMLLRGKHRGFHLGPYVILRPLGHGAMGSVFLAQHVVMNRRCAIKVLPFKSREGPDSLNRFQIEARAVAALDHPNIVRAYDFNKDTGTGSEVHYLVMEYIEGQDLQRMVEKDGVLEFHRAVDLVRQAAVGLAYAHEAGFVHRDIKPANLLVDSKGVLKILDLGLARFTREARIASPGGPLLSGTPDYIAPEQIMDSPGLDGRADIYSLGLTFYFLLVGRRPYMKETLPEILMAHRREQPPRIENTRPDIPFELTRIFEKMIAKEPEQRYKTANELAAELQTWLSNEASGRPSRLSAIKAAAMRSRQRATSDSVHSRPQPTASADLDVAPLEEQSPHSTVSMQVVTADTKRSRKGEKDAQARPKETQQRVADAQPEIMPDLPVSGPIDDAVSTSVAGLLADLPIEAELLPAPPSASPATSLAARPWWRRFARATPKSPWLWVAIATLFVAVMLSWILQF
jgi:eukaryotic-like serine/threonine-protein kinase